MMRRKLWGSEGLACVLEKLWEVRVRLEWWPAPRFIQRPFAEQCFLVAQSRGRRVLGTGCDTQGLSGEWLEGIQVGLWVESRRAAGPPLDSWAPVSPCSFQKTRQITSCSSLTCRRRPTNSCCPCFSTSKWGLWPGGDWRVMARRWHRGNGPQNSAR